MADLSMLKYYQDNKFNPAPIDVEDKAVWESHLAKRFNLYQRHLGIPLSMLGGRSVLEIGCNSGENALVYASVGADLTLVEPNGHVLPRLKMLFKKFGFEKNIVELVQEDIDTFTPKRAYEMVIAEGFLFTLPNRDQLVQKIAGLLSSHGLAVISFNDRYGCLLERTKRTVMWRACQLAGVDDVQSRNSLELGWRLFGEDFSELEASRDFKTWWKENLAHPIFGFPCLWSYKKLLPLIEEADCEFYSSSPKWSRIEEFMWYKNVLDRKRRHQRLLEEQRERFCFFLTGLTPPVDGTEPASSEVISSVSELVMQLSEYTTDISNSIDATSYPVALDKYFNRCKDSRLLRFNSEMKELFAALKSTNLEELISVYRGTRLIRRLWGVPYHYLCFKKV